MKHLLLALGFLCLQPAALRADDLPRVKATEEKAIRGLAGKKATVSGRVIATKETKNGMTFLDFEGGKFTVVAWKEDYAKFEGGSPAKLYGKQEIEVTGTILDYKSKSAKPGDPGKLEIKLKSPDQVKITREAGAEDKDAKEAADSKEAPEKKPDKNDKAPKADDAPKTPTESAPAPGNEPKPAPDSKPGRVDAKKFFK
ncbi:MAG: hypothetical protein V4726_05030 [Verrucomicrobiota bacterium]